MGLLKGKCWYDFKNLVASKIAKNLAEKMFNSESALLDKHVIGYYTGRAMADSISNDSGIHSEIKNYLAENYEVLCQHAIESEVRRTTDILLKEKLQEKIDEAVEAVTVETIMHEMERYTQ